MFSDSHSQGGARENPAQLEDLPSHPHPAPGLGAPSVVSLQPNPTTRAHRSQAGSAGSGPDHLPSGTPKPTASSPYQGACPRSQNAFSSWALRLTSSLGYNNLQGKQGCCVLCTNNPLPTEACRQTGQARAGTTGALSLQQSLWPHCHGAGRYSTRLALCICASHCGSKEGSTEPGRAQLTVWHQQIPAPL